jgi:isoleucyl-tRNA synthetase
VPPVRRPPGAGDRRQEDGQVRPGQRRVADALIGQGKLLARGRLEHSYPHSWRSKAPVIYRNTPQWFIRLDEGSDERTESLRDLALAGVDATQFVPDAGRNRIRGMVEGRPDWLISRQRAWGTPIAMFVSKDTGEPLRDPAVNARVQEIIRTEGADAWFTRPVGDFLPGYDPAAYERIDDILDVWFDSGSTHAFTLEGRPDTRWPADLYLEGSDQHAVGSRPPCWSPARRAGRRVPRGADPRLHAGRERRDDEQVQGQHRRPADVHKGKRRRDPAPGPPPSTTRTTSASARPCSRR